MPPLADDAETSNRGDDPRMMWMEERVCASMKLKPEKWRKLMMSDNGKYV